MPVLGGALPSIVCCGIVCVLSAGAGMIVFGVVVFVRFPLDRFGFVFLGGVEALHVVVGLVDVFLARAPVLECAIDGFEGASEKKGEGGMDSSLSSNCSGDEEDGEG